MSFHSYIHCRDDLAAKERSSHRSGPLIKSVICDSCHNRSRYLRFLAVLIRRRRTFRLRSQKSKPVPKGGGILARPTKLGSFAIFSKQWRHKHTRKVLVFFVLRLEIGGKDFESQCVSRAAPMLEKCSWFPKSRPPSILMPSWAITVDDNPRVIMTRAKGSKVPPPRSLVYRPRKRKNPSFCLHVLSPPRQLQQAPAERLYCLKTANRAAANRCPARSDFD